MKRCYDVPNVHKAGSLLPLAGLNLGSWLLGRLGPSEPVGLCWCKTSLGIQFLRGLDFLLSFERLKHKRGTAEPALQFSKKAELGK
ncbi:hypothetical protein QE152_g25217 [Popillia japonica]|uniref:Uncharacterized protein n=1 Tax=Popillia japonica TaxID=7064 RepID=A0AAW1K2W0_POPJA